MTRTEALDPSLFIGSSTEGLPVAKHLQSSLDRVCEPTIWTQGIFGPSSTSISSLLEATAASDFAVLTLTSDDVLHSRGSSHNVARDNVIFELGLFMGTLGADRVFIVTPRGAKLQLPSDLAGVATLDYNAGRQDGNLEAALGPTATKIETKISALGLRLGRNDPSPSAATATRRGLTRDEEQAELDRELSAIERAASAQGWTVKTKSSSAFRLVSKSGQRYSFALAGPAVTRDRLREFARQLQQAGLRISGPVLSPVNAE